MNSLFSFSQGESTKRLLLGFNNVLVSLWQRYLLQNRNAPPRIALAVSGGLDSMTLAFLCLYLQKKHPSRSFADFQFQAYVVDHAMRIGSDDEAIRVRARLHSMGMPARILTLTWPTEFKKSDLESQARRLRYRALGTACAKNSYPLLMLGHHNDDQAETAFMRLASRQRGPALNPMKEIAKIPESRGVHGVGSSSFSDISLTSEFPVREDTITPELRSIFETRFVSVMRPLLCYSKDQLKQICRDNSISWEEDESNQDPTMTPRNTIRSLLGSGKLPLALEKYSMLWLSQNIRESEIARRKIAQKIFEKCDIVFLDLRSGVLMVRIPTDILSDIPEAEQSRASLRSSVMYCLRSFVRIISSYEDVPLDTLELATKTLFPQLLTSSSDSETSFPNKCPPDKINIFTTRRVIFQRMLSNDPHDTSAVWRLSRQQWMQEPPTIVIPPQDPNSRHSPSAWSQWHFFDSRYWIRIMNLSPHPLHIRTMKAFDMSSMRMEMTRSRFDILRGLLTVSAPSKVRWTLPIIVAVDNESEELAEGQTGFGGGTVIGLPTLGPYDGWVAPLSFDRGKSTEAWRRKPESDQVTAGLEPVAEPKSEQVMSASDLDAELKPLKSGPRMLSDWYLKPGALTKNLLPNRPAGRQQPSWYADWYDRRIEEIKAEMAGETAVHYQWESDVNQGTPRSIQWEIKYKDIPTEWMERAQQEGFLKSWRTGLIKREEEIFTEFGNERELLYERGLPPKWIYEEEDRLGQMGGAGLDGGGEEIPQVEERVSKPLRDILGINEESEPIDEVVQEEIRKLRRDIDNTSRKRR